MIESSPPGVPSISGEKKIAQRVDDQAAVNGLHPFEHVGVGAQHEVCPAARELAVQPLLLGSWSRAPLLASVDESDVKGGRGSGCGARPRSVGCSE